MLDDANFSSPKTSAKPDKETGVDLPTGTKKESLELIETKEQYGKCHHHLLYAILQRGELKTKKPLKASKGDVAVDMF